MYLDIALVIFIGLLIIFLLACFPVLLKLWRLINELSFTVSTLNQSLPLMMKNMEEITTHLNHSTETLNQKIQNIADASGRSRLMLTDMIAGLGLLIPLANKIPVLRLLKNFVAAMKGIRVFVNVLFNKDKISPEN